MDKLTYLETLEAEKQEAIKAKKKALLQEEQRQKRLWYLPLLVEILILMFVVAWMYLLMFGAGFVTGEASKDCPIISCPLVQSVCELPETGARE